MVLLVGSFQRRADLCISFCIELQELLVQSASTSEVGHRLEEALLALPDPLRAVVMLRDVEELNTEETAEALGISEDNVKIRLHRGRAIVRGWLFQHVGAKTKDAFPFMGARCDRVVHNVFARLS
jgi:RNA polymerase sigma-70 factor, ECF subfamily